MNQNSSHNTLHNSAPDLFLGYQPYHGIIPTAYNYFTNNSTTTPSSQTGYKPLFFTLGFGAIFDAWARFPVNSNDINKSTISTTKTSFQPTINTLTNNGMKTLSTTSILNPAPVMPIYRFQNYMMFPWQTRLFAWSIISLAIFNAFSTHTGPHRRTRRNWTNFYGNNITREDELGYVNQCLMTHR